MVSNTLHAAAILLREGPDWDWFINLSASDYPLVSQDDLLHTFSYLPRDLNFIDHTSNIRGNQCEQFKYLSSVEANEMEIEKLRRCSEQETCDCQRLLRLKTLPWSNKFSCTLKQLSLARCPKILCIHLKRVSINMFGEPVKLQV